MESSKTSKHEDHSDDKASTREDLLSPQQTEAMRKMFAHLKPDPITGELNDSDILQFVNANPNDPIVKTIFGLSDKEAERRKEKEQDDLKNFDASKLRIQSGAIWLVSLEYSGLTTDAKWDDKWDISDEAPILKQRRDEELAGAPKQTFQLLCNIKEGPEALGGGDDIRKVVDFVGLPTCKQIEDFLKLCMASPIRCWKPCIPQTLGFSHNLRIHEANLKPFLNQFPFPFTWIFESDYIHERVQEKNMQRADDSFKRYLKYSADLKDQANAAFEKGQREEAIKKFQDAAQNLDKLLLKKVSEPQEKEAETRRLLAICLSNCAAARLLVVDGRKDAHGAIQDAERAIEADAAYPKSYIRLSRAHEELGDPLQAQRALVRGLRLKSLENHYGLADHLLALQTEGRGLRVLNKAEFAAWSNRILVEDPDVAELVRGLDGA